MTYVDPSKIKGSAYAEFCDITGSVEVNGKRLWICKQHGRVDLVPFYSRYRSGIVSTSPVWACEVCVRLNFDDFGVAEEETSEDLITSLDHCYKCQRNKKKIKNDELESCELCGKLACPIHRLGGVCDDCSRGCITC